MIEINLLPGAGKKKSKGSGGDAGIDFGGLVSGFIGKVKDPWLVGGVATVALVIAAVGMLHVKQTARARSLTDRQQKAVQDSLRYAAVLNEKRKAEAQRDSVLRQLNVIRSIDNNRFVWPHLLDEISRALPPYTWLTSVRQTSEPVSAAARPAQAGNQRGGPRPVAPKPQPKTTTAAAGRNAAPPAPARDTIKFQIVGNTADFQALTRFMRLLEASPFVEGVELTRTVLVLEQQREVTQFVLDARYEEPDSSLIRRVPLTLTMSR